MKVQLVSDLHAEHRGLTEIDDLLHTVAHPGADLLIAAGDICNWINRDVTGALLKTMSQLWDDVIYVPGNHEFYGTSPYGALSSVQLCRAGNPNEVDRYPNVHVVTGPQTLTIRGQRFICGTGWYPWAEVANLGGGDADQGLFWEGGRLFQWSDFRKITGVSPWVWGEHTRMRNLLKQELRYDDVVVTHMLPSMESYDPRFKDAVSNIFFDSRFESFLAERQPKLWVHGHTHTPFDYWFGETRVVCNPLGAPSERSISQYGSPLIEV